MKNTFEHIVSSASTYLTQFYEILQKGNLTNFEYAQIEKRVIADVNSQLTSIKLNVNNSKHSQNSFLNNSNIRFNA